jgi:hypothetical protein
MAEKDFHTFTFLEGFKLFSIIVIGEVMAPSFDSLIKTLKEKLRD